MAVQTQMQVRRGTAASWTSTNPTLAAGEWGLETDTGKTKIGDGATAWASLPYASLSVTAGTGISVSTASNVSTVTNTMATTIDAKGDLVAGTGADTFSRLAAGANGLFLTTDSAEATGLKWSTVPGTSTAGTAKISSGFGATTYTYSFTMNPGAYNVYVWNSNSPNGYVASKLTFGSTTFGSNQVKTWTATANPGAGVGNVNTVNITTSLASFTIDNRDSAQWTSKANNLSNSPGQFATFGNSTFVVGMGNNVYATSTDGLTWTTRALFGATTTRYLTFGNGIFVAGKADGVIATSTDAITWTTRANFGSTALNSNQYNSHIKYISGLTFPWFIASALSSVSVAGIASTDGITWATVAHTGGREPYLGYTGSNNFTTVKRIAWTSNGTLPNAYYTTGDNFTWVSRANPTIYGGICSIETDGSIYVMVTAGSGASTTATNTIYTSTDGITWTQRVQDHSITSSFDANYTRRTNIFYSSTPTYKWLMSSDTVTHLSTDGITWQLTNGINAATNSITFGLSKWVTVENSDTGEITTSNGMVYGDTYISVAPAGSVTTIV